MSLAQWPQRSDAGEAHWTHGISVQVKHYTTELLRSKING